MVPRAIQQIIEQHCTFERIILVRTPAVQREDFIANPREQDRCRFYAQEFCFARRYFVKIGEPLKRH
jgi:hypothetical protein